MAELLYRLGRACARRARTVLAAWLAVLVLAGAAFVAFGGTLASSFSIPGTPTADVTERLQTALPEASGGTGTIVLTTEDGAPFTPEQEAQVADRFAAAEDVDGVESVVDPFATQTELADQRRQVEDGRTQIAAGREQIEDGRAQLAAGQEQLDAARAQLDAGQEQLDAARAQAEDAGALAQVGPQLDAQQAELDAGRAELDTQVAALEKQVAALEDQSATLEEQSAQLELSAPLLDMAADIRLVSEDGSAAVASVVFSEPNLSIEQETKDALVAVFDEPVDGVRADFSSDIAQGVPQVFGVGEAVGLVVAAVVLVVMLGTLVGAGLPILTALVGVGIGALAAMSLSGVVEMSSVTPVLGLMLGLAVGIDYSLFIVNRHRRQLKQGDDLAESIALANGTSGNAVVFAGATVLIALLALNVTGIPFLGLMGTVGALCVAIAVLIAVTLTPALLGMIGPRILSRRERAALAALAGPAATTGASAGTASSEPGAAGGLPAAEPVRPMSTVRAVGTALLAVVALGVIALPALDLRTNLPDGSSEAHDSTQYRAYSTVAEEFGEGTNGPLLVVADLPGEPTEAEALEYQVGVAEELFAQDDVVAVAPIGTSEDRTVAAFQVIPAEGPTSESTEELVHALRALEPLDGEVTLGVAGSASGNIDISEKLAQALPIYLAVVVGLSLVILVLVFRSIFVPVVATLGFILSYFAALGGVVAIYQWGWLAGVFGVETPGPILNFLPTILVGILFGLAMDYQLFLGSGMREAYAHGAPARVAIVQGVRAGRAVVTAAAIIMISVFGGFVFSHSAMIRPIGFALAFGVLVDAFVVRMLLVPALMHLVGDKAWWLPRWLDRILPDVDVEGAALERRHPHHHDGPGADAPDAAATDPDATEPEPARR
ncbi:MMPL family transporter [Cellulosimicrobium composti]|uniref:MMPL family transporter n=1 Tax=Cellulosimicrobium composti TaxID=2672572 RepID=A0ABX0B938_9MICO|nr:MMPL family transporter [Cellulosimicrobium composti]NDO88468.1 MMPL family transporter [Cellulosimicrobium composti]